jgi:hypothetical protein
MMKMKTALAAACSAFLLTSAPVLAEDREIEFETDIVKDSKDVQLDPGKAYILLQTPVAVPATFFRIPSDEEREIDANQRAEALAEAKEKYVKRKERYDRAVESYKNRRATFQGEKPIEPTEENFAWAPVEQSLMFSIGPFNRFAKSKGNSLYLTEVPPGEYVYYGTTSMGMGACACMGTVRFKVEPGTITAMRYDGVWLDPRGEPIGRGKKPKDLDTIDALVRVAMIIEPVDEGAYDPRLPRDWIVDADLTPVKFVPNWFGAEINRLAPIPGVLAYRRDEVVDVKAELAAELAAKERAAEAAAEAAAAEAEAEAAAAALAAEAEAADDASATAEAEVEPSDD